MRCKGPTLLAPPVRERDGATATARGSHLLTRRQSTTAKRRDMGSAAGGNKNDRHSDSASEATPNGRCGSTPGAGCASGDATTIKRACSQACSSTAPHSEYITLP